ncbi:MAG: hypothetical protein H6922_06540 [Pseudomonadaceae bacterium]|nr:hypothetical protein [Pseudomonadaceae bacterium]
MGGNKHWMGYREFQHHLDEIMKRKLPLSRPAAATALRQVAVSVPEHGRDVAADLERAVKVFANMRKRSALFKFADGVPEWECTGADFETLMTILHTRTELRHKVSGVNWKTFGAPRQTPLFGRY